MAGGLSRGAAGEGGAVRGCWMMEGDGGGLKGVELEPSDTCMG